eukprot:3167945-Alexandrium_andersonii.AAC.2
MAQNGRSRMQHGWMAGRTRSAALAARSLQMLPHCKQAGQQHGDEGERAEGVPREVAELSI